MGTDFYPRLTGIANDNSACNRMVNEQAEVSLLLAGPGILATLTFAPLVIQVFYSARFAPALYILYWQILGILLRVASWPLGYILLAKGKGRVFFLTELFTNIVHICLVLILLHFFGLPGTGMAFCGVYIFYWILISVVSKKISGFSLSKANRRSVLVVTPSVVVVFLSVILLPQKWGMAVGALMTIGIGSYCLNALRIALGADRVRQLLSKLRARIPFISR
jgi:PST family polysaccharide transporter